MGLLHAIFHQDLNMQKKANNIETKVFVKVTNAEPKPVALLLKVKYRKVGISGMSTTFIFIYNFSYH